MKTRIAGLLIILIAGIGAGSFSPPASLDPKIASLSAEPYKSGDLKGTAAAASGGRTKVRQLFSFEDGKDGQPIPYLMKKADDIDAVYVMDNGVTDGKWCARLTIPASKTGVIVLDGPEIKDWSDYDYCAFDLYTNDEQPYPFHFELWDQDSKNYPTRCTFDMETHVGKQTLLIQINRAKRNGKEGRTWEEAEPADKIDMNHLKMVKFFIENGKDHPAQFWIDNIRLMQEDAAKPKMQVSLPAGAMPFKFGNAGTVVPGFTTITPKSQFSDASAGFESTENLSETSKGWPDLIAGTFVTAPHNKQMTFKAKVPNGDYRLWLCAGPILDAENPDPKFLLKINDKVIEQDNPTFKEFDSEKYLYRFLWTQYSERPHALWLDYINRMYPVRDEKVTVSDGTLSITAQDYFISAAILVPATESEDFERMTAKLQTARMAAFEATMFTPEHKRPEIAAQYALWVPDDFRQIEPWSGPVGNEKDRKSIEAAGAQGQNVIMRLAVLPGEDLGPCKFEISDLKSQDGAIIAGSNVLGHIENYRTEGVNVREMALVPTLSSNGEKGIAQSYWLWLTIPADAKAGQYSGTFTFQPTEGKSTAIPVQLQVYPFALESKLPMAYGMYYGGRILPKPPQDIYWDTIKSQFTWMHKLGMTASNLMADAEVTGVDGNTGKVTLRFSPGAAKIAKEAGFAQLPQQQMMTDQLGIARSIGRRLLIGEGKSGAAMDSNPGLELTVPQMRACYFDAMKQWKVYLDSLDIPYAIQVVDEPREVPNPWNRNLADTIKYCDWMKEVGFTTRFITPMGDSSGEKDYTVLPDHADILSLHAWEGSKGIMHKSVPPKNTLWFYNTGMSRYTWGFYAFARGATGRWEWHWSTPEHNSQYGYPGDDWYNPFTGSDGYAVNAPIDEFAGGFLYKSAFLTCADGITDYAYIYTLEQAIEKHKNDAAKAATIEKARNFLKEIRDKMPEFPSGAESDDAVNHLNAWRAQIAGMIMELQ